MATLALSVAGGLVGGALFGPAGAVVGRGLGALAGAYVDQTLFGPKAKNTSQEGPRLNDLKTSISSYGAVVALAYGQRVRCGTNVIWSQELLETATTTSTRSGGGGKGGGQKRSTSSTTSYSYAANFAAMICEGPIQGIRRIFGDGKVFWDSTQSPNTNLASGVRIYLGSDAQAQDSLIAAVEGAANTPAYRGVAYIVFEGLQLANFGNRIPSIEVDFEPAQESVGGALTKLAARAGVDRVDCASIDLTLPGYVVRRPASARAAMEELMTGFSLIGVSSPGGIVIKPRGIGNTGGMDFDSFGTGQNTATDGERYSVSRAEEAALPSSLSMTFADPARDYQENTVRASRQDGTAANRTSYDFALVLDANLAKARAEQILRDLWAARTTIDGLRLPPSFQSVRPGDSLDVLLGGAWRRINVTKATIGANGLVEVSGAAEVIGAWVPRVATATSPPVRPSLFPAIVATTLVPMDIPMLSSLDNDAGFYFVAGGPVGWRSAAVLRAADNVNFGEIAYPVGQGIIGTCGTTLADGPWLFIDEAATLDVTLLDTTDTLETTTNAGLYAGRNGALVGSEIIQFRTATLIAAATYRLSGLVRGRMGTDRHTGTHVAAERFVLLDGFPGVERVRDGISLRGAPFWYKGVSLYQQASAVLSFAFTNTSQALIPYSPLAVVGTRNGGLDIALSWARRTRMPSTWSDGVDAPLGETAERYDVEIMNGGTVVRTIAVTAQAATYLAAEQVTDFGSAQASLVVRVYQVSPEVGRGPARVATV